MEKSPSTHTGRRWAVCAAAAALMTAVAPAGPAAADTASTSVVLNSGEGAAVGSLDQFNRVSPDGGNTWGKPTAVATVPGWDVIPGTGWISSDADSGVSREGSTTLFRREFTLPAGVTGSTATVCLHADNSAAVTVNGTSVLSQAGDAGLANFQNPAECSPADGLFLPGRNRIDFTVVNGTGALGLDYRVELAYTVDLDAPPLMLLPDDVTELAAFPTGTLILFNPQALDTNEHDFYLTPSCTPDSNSFFPIGTTTVTCTATGFRGHSSTGTFTVTVIASAVPLEIHLPGDMSVTAPSRSGAVVTFAATATGDDAWPPTVSCEPPSGTLFPIGTTEVSCGAIDSLGRFAGGSFSVTVHSPLERSCRLLLSIPGITLSTRMVAGLRAAADALHVAGHDREAGTLRTLALRVKAAGTQMVRPALRQSVNQQVGLIRTRLCCR